MQDRKKIVPKGHFLMRCSAYITFALAVFTIPLATSAATGSAPFFISVIWELCEVQAGGEFCTSAAVVTPNDGATVRRCTMTWKRFSKPLQFLNDVCTNVTAKGSSLTAPINVAVYERDIDTRNRNLTNGNSGIWRVSQTDGKVEYCVFGPDGGGFGIYEMTCRMPRQ